MEDLSKQWKRMYSQKEYENEIGIKRKQPKGFLCFKPTTLTSIVEKTKKVADNFIQNEGKIAGNHEYSCAYVTFRSTEGRNRMLELFDRNPLMILINSIRTSEGAFEYEGKHYHLQAKPADNPESIIWENLSFSAVNRLFRLAVTVLVFIAIVIASFYLQTL
jgi:hypothetical protein